MDKDEFIKRLSLIRGVNYEIASALYETGYHSIRDFKDAIPKDLMLASRISPTLARRILENLKEQPKVDLNFSSSSELTAQTKPRIDMIGVWSIKASLWGLLYIWLIGICIIPIDFFTGSFIVTSICIILSIILFFIARASAGLFYDSYQFHIKDSEILVEHGVLFHKRSIIPFKRIQNVNVVQGPISRLYNVKSIQVETAGGSIYRPGPSGTGMAEGQIPGPNNPEQLADLIIENVKKYKAAEGL